MKVSGIYKIENLINGKVYIGQSKDLFLRYSQHFSNGMKSDEGRRNRSEATKLMWKNGKFVNRENNPNMQRKGRKMPESMRLKMKLVSKLREQKHHEDYELYIIQGGELNYSEFCKHYTNGKNSLLED